MFYKKKWLFFSALFIISLVLAYFVNQKIILIGIFENFLLLTGIIYAGLLLSSAVLSLPLTFFIKILTALIYKIFGKKDRAFNGFFVFWLNLTVFSYVTALGVFMISITY